MGVREDDCLDRLVGDLTKLPGDLLRRLTHHAGINNDNAVISDDHRDVGNAEADGNVDVVSHFDDLFLELVVLLGQPLGRVVLREREAWQEKCGG